MWQLSCEPWAATWGGKNVAFRNRGRWIILYFLTCLYIFCVLSVVGTLLGNLAPARISVVDWSSQVRDVLVCEHEELFSKIQSWGLINPFVMSTLESHQSSKFLPFSISQLYLYHFTVLHNLCVLQLCLHLPNPHLSSAYSSHINKHVLFLSIIYLLHKHHDRCTFHWPLNSAQLLIPIFAPVQTMFSFRSALIP